MRDPDLLISLTTYYMAGAFMMLIMMAILHRFHRRDYLLAWALSWAVLLVAYFMLYYGYQFDGEALFWMYGFFALTAVFLQHRGMFMFLDLPYHKVRFYGFSAMLALFMVFSAFGGVSQAGIFSVFAFIGLIYLDAGYAFVKKKKRPFVIYGGVLSIYALLIAMYPVLIAVATNIDIIGTFFILLGMAVAYGMIIMHLIDVFEREQSLQKELYYLSFHDHMTGLRNRAYLESFLDTLDASDEVNAAIMMTDLDTLKSINDKHGHAAGDAMIIRTAEILREVSHKTDVLVRYGGDEFVAVYANRDANAMKAIEEHIKKRTKEEKVKDTPLSMSIGYAVHEKKRSIYETLRQAEKRMYEQKRAKLK